MMTVKVWMIIALTISLSVNVFLVWFSREQSQKLSYVSQNLGDLVELVSNYGKHLKQVYSLEMFYGDETLKLLMEHTNALVLIIQEEYSEITYLTDPLEVTFDEEEQIEEENENEEIQKDVFYGGTRTSNT